MEIIRTDPEQNAQAVENQSSLVREVRQTYTSLLQEMLFQFHLGLIRLMTS